MGIRRIFDLGMGNDLPMLSNMHWFTTGVQGKKAKKKKGMRRFLSLHSIGCHCRHAERFTTASEPLQTTDNQRPTERYPRNKCHRHHRPTFVTNGCRVPARPFGCAPPLSLLFPHTARDVFLPLLHPDIQGRSDVACSDEILRALALSDPSVLLFRNSPYPQVCY